MNKTKVIEGIKSTIIVLLALSALLMLNKMEYYSGAFESVRDFLTGGSVIAESSKGDTGEGSHTLSIPVALSVRTEMGRYASAYSSELVEEDYRRFSASLGEALGSAGKAENISRDDWVEALESESVYFEFFAPQSLEELSAQLGAKLSAAAGEALVSRFCLSCEDNGTLLYYRSGDGYFRCATAVSTSGLSARMAELTPNGAYFSHSDKTLDGFGESVLMLRGKLQPRSISSSAVRTVEELAPSFLKTFNMSEYTVSSYSEADGTRVYLDSDRILKISPSAKLSYEYSAGVKTGEYSTAASAAHHSRMIVNSCLAPYCGDAQLYISDARQDGDSFYISYDYLMDGIPVYMGNYRAADFIFKNGSLVSAEFVCKNYIFGDAALSVLPMYQAAAVAAGEGSDGIELVYADSAEGIRCVWVKK